MQKCRNYATAIRIAYGVFAVIIAIALMIISIVLNNGWYFVVSCLIYSLWIVVALAYAAHLDAVAEGIAQNERIIELLSGKPQTTPVTAPNVGAPAAEKNPVVQEENIRAEETPVNVSNADESDWIVCRVCGVKQRRNHIKCIVCGSVFEKWF